MCHMISISQIYEKRLTERRPNRYADPLYYRTKYSAQEMRSGFAMSKVLTDYNPPNLCLIRRTVLMPGPLPQYPIQLTPEQEGHLQHLSTSYTAPFAEVPRARILLLAHQ